MAGSRLRQVHGLRIQRYAARHGRTISSSTITGATSATMHPTTSRRRASSTFATINTCRTRTRGGRWKTNPSSSTTPRGRSICISGRVEPARAKAATAPTAPKASRSSSITRTATGRIWAGSAQRCSASRTRGMTSSLQPGEMVPVRGLHQAQHRRLEQWHRETLDRRCERARSRRRRCDSHTPTCGSCGAATRGRSSVSSDSPSTTSGATPGAPAQRTQHHKWDNIVISKTPIGPMR